MKEQKMHPKNLKNKILPPNSVERALSHLLMSPITSPDDHSPIEPAQYLEINNTIKESDINMEDFNL